jgi:hypothetical protein
MSSSNVIAQRISGSFCHYVASALARQVAILGSGWRECGIAAAGPDPGALVAECRLCHGPPIALAADQISRGTDRLVEKDLVEKRSPRHFSKGPNLNAQLVQLEGEPRDAGVFGAVKVRAREQHPVIRLHRLRAPDLLSRYHPRITVEFRPRLESGEIRAVAGLAEELAPPDAPIENRREEAPSSI